MLVLLTRRRFPAFIPDRNFTDTFKGLAMFLILYHHSRIYHGSDFWFLFGGGDAYTGVSMFFFISGFGLVRSQEKKQLDFVRFLTVRSLALIPGVVLCMLLRVAIGPLWGGKIGLESDPLTLLGLREWFIVAIWTYYLAFIISWMIGRSRFERGLCTMVAILLIASGLAQASLLSTIASSWLRFPFSFAMGVLLAGHMEQTLDFCRRQAILILAVTGITLGLVWIHKIDTYTTIWLADVAIIPCSIAGCSLLYRFNLTSGFWLFMGRNSLYLFLLQVPLLKYGWFTHVWRKDMIGLMACWTVIATMAAGVGWLRNMLVRSLTWRRATQ
jgi:peptidoglycan/LPS O-acetylase OafA/YrhL